MNTFSACKTTNIRIGLIIIHLSFDVLIFNIQFLYQNYIKLVPKNKTMILIDLILE